MKTEKKNQGHIRPRFREREKREQEREPTTKHHWFKRDGERRKKAEK